jgi:uncharacterized protein
MKMGKSGLQGGGFCLAVLNVNQIQGVTTVVRKILRPWAFRLLRLVVLIFLLTQYLLAVHAYSLLHFSEAASSKPPYFRSMSSNQKIEALLFGLKIPRPKETLNPKALGLDVRTYDVTTSDGVRISMWDLHYNLDRPVVLMLHGFGGERSRLLHEAKEFISLGLHPILIDFRGHGASGGQGSSIGFYEAEDVLAAVLSSKKKYSPSKILIYGKSMGAVAAMRASGPLGLIPSQLILECPFDRLLETIRNRMYFFGAPRYGIPEGLVFWGGLMQGFNGFNHNPVDYAKLIKSPTLLLGGANDSRATPENIREIYGEIRGTKKIRIFAGTNHNDIYSSNRSDWMSTVREFLDRQNL